MKEIFIWLSENWVNQITCILELVLILICIHSVFVSKFRISIKSIVTIILVLLILALVNSGTWPPVFSILSYVIFFVYCKQEFKIKLFETIAKFILSFLAVGIIEIIARIATIPFRYMLPDENTWMLLINVIGVFLAVIFFHVVKIGIRKKRVKLDKEKWDMLIVIAGLYLVVTIIDYRVRGVVDQLYYCLFLIACVIVFFETIETQEARHELEKKKLEIEMRKVYQNTYKELIFEVRKRQHDFKNQLSAIYSMHLTATSLEELIEKQKQYGDTLIHKSRYDKMLFGCSDSILAGYLYYRFLALENDNIQVDYTVNVERATCLLSLYEIIEILGILTTNVAENYEDVAGDKIIRLTIQETLHNLYIEVSNKSRKFSVSEIEKMFEYGYSTKGTERGIGLPRIKELAEKTNSDRIVDNKMFDEENWLSFAIVIPKEERRVAI